MAVVVTKEEEEVTVIRLDVLSVRATMCLRQNLPAPGTEEGLHESAFPSGGAESHLSNEKEHAGGTRPLCARFRPDVRIRGLLTFPLDFRADSDKQVVSSCMSTVGHARIGSPP